MYIPVDSRAQITLNHLLRNYITDVNSSTCLREIVRAIIRYFPITIAYEVELCLRIKRETNLAIIRSEAINIAQNNIAKRVCEGLPVNNNDHCYFMREDILRWVGQRELVNLWLEPEIITVHCHNNIETFSLVDDALIGVSYAINAINDGQIILISSLTDIPIKITNIVDHAIIYRLPINLATEAMKRPYSIDIIQTDKFPLPLTFTSLNFMEGIKMVAQWYRIPNDGKNVIWKNLCRNGSTLLEF